MSVSASWVKTALIGKIHVKHGFSFKSEYFAECGEQIVLTPGNFYEAGGFKYQTGKEKFYTSSNYPPEYLLKKGDLVVAMTEQAEGLLGSTALVPESKRYLHNQRIGLVTAVNGEVDTEFLYHLFKTKSVREQIRNSSSGSKVKHTSPERIYAVEVMLPPAAEQQRIAETLSALEAKIDLNNRINAELEALAKTIYDYWFVQFDFPDDKGRPYKNSGGNMVYNTSLKREIPEGWEACKVNDLILKVPPAEKVPTSAVKDDGTIPVIDQSTDYICGYTDDVQSQISPECPHIVFGDHTRIVKLVTFKYARGADGTQILVPNRKIISPLAFYHAIKSIDLSNYGYARHFKFLKDSEAIIPEFRVSRMYEELAESWFHMIDTNRLQNRELTQLRDWLLPMLMNGQVKVA